MEALDEKIAMLERGQRSEKQKKEQVTEKAAIERPLSMDEIRMAVRKGKVSFPGHKKLCLKTVVLFPEQIPMIYIDDYYTDKQETEEMAIYVNNDENVGQTLIHLPENMEKLSMKAWARQIKEGIKEKGMYADIMKSESLPYLDYIAYRTASKKGWLYNIIFRIHQKNRRVIGAYNCMEKDMETYGQLIEAMVLETQRQL